MLNLKDQLQQDLIKNIKIGITPKDVRSENLKNLTLNTFITNHIKEYRNQRIHNKEALSDQETKEQVTHQENEILNETNSQKTQKTKKRPRSDETNPNNISDQEDQTEIEKRIKKNKTKQRKQYPNDKELPNNNCNNSAKLKSKIIAEIIKFKDYNININDEFSDDSNIYRNENQILDAYKATKSSDYTKWKNVLIFLNLTNNMDYEKIGTAINKNKDSTRKILLGFNRVKKFLSYINTKNYSNIQLGISYFQKVNSNDWNQILSMLDNIDNN
jgi:hypothetical protein